MSPVITCSTCNFAHVIVNRRKDGKFWCVMCQEWREEKPQEKKDAKNPLFN